MGAGSPKVHESALVRMLCINQPLFQVHAKKYELMNIIQILLQSKSKSPKKKKKKTQVTKSFARTKGDFTKVSYVLWNGSMKKRHGCKVIPHVLHGLFVL
jgi:hypothetical protein